MDRHPPMRVGRGTWRADPADPLRRLWVGSGL